MTSCLIINARIVTESGVVDDGWLHIEAGRITAYGAGSPDETLTVAQPVDAQGGLLLPGFIDVHVHGARGADTMDADADSLYQMARFFAQHGVTTFLPTTLTATHEQTLDALQMIKSVMQHPPDDGARIAGAHLEGPYINPQKSGAQDADLLRAIDRDEVRELLALDVIKLLSFAPELDDSLWLIETCLREGVTVSAAHTAATYEQMQTALRHGLHHATHTYNAMPKLHHRDPGGLAALLLSEQVRCELIADNIHVHPAMMRLLYHLKGENGVILITDAMRAAGMPDGLYHLGRYDVTLKNGRATLSDGTLAGSVLTMDRALVNFADAVSEPVINLWRVSSLNAARAIGLDNTFGSIAPGNVADLVLLQPEFPHEVLMTLRGRQIIYEREDDTP